MIAPLFANLPTARPICKAGPDGSLSARAAAEPPVPSSMTFWIAGRTSTSS